MISDPTRGSSETPTEQQVWDRVTAMLGDHSKTLGRHWSFNLRNDPKRLAFVLSRYKLAGKLASPGNRVLELGCSEGIGCPILAETAASYTGVDMDENAIAAAEQNFANERCRFVGDDFLGKVYGEFDSVVSLDVIEHIHGDYEDLFFDTVFKNLANDGVCVIGTPNITSQVYASEMSKRGHINLYDGDRLAKSLGKIFHNVLRFGINDEIVHTGYEPMAHYLIHVGCYKRTCDG